MPLRDRIGYRSHIEPNRTDCIVIARYHKIDSIGVAVRINHPKYRNTQLIRFTDCNMFVLDIDHKDCIRQSAHILNPAQASIELFFHTAFLQRFFLGQHFEGSIFCLLFQVLQASDRLSDCLVVSQHTAQPALINIRHTYPARLLSNDFSRRPLGADKKDFVSLSRQLLNFA